MNNKKRKGATAVEFALVFPIFLSLIFFVIEGMMITSGISAMQWICNRAIHDMTEVDPTPSTDQVTQNAKGYAQKEGYDTTVMTFTTTQNSCGSTTCMTIKGTWYVKVPLLEGMMSPFTFTSQSTMPIPDNS